MSEAGSRRKSRLLNLARVAATVLLVGAVLYAVPLGDTWQALRTILWVPVVWALAGELGQRVMAILRWHLLLPPAGLRLPFAQTLRLGFIGLFYNNFMPSTVGGDVAKSYLAIKGQPTAPAAVVASVLVDRFVVGWGSLVVCGLIISAFLDTPRFQTALLVLLVAGAVAAGAVLLLARRRVDAEAELPAGLLARLVRQAADKLTEVSTALLQYRRHHGSLAASWLVSCLNILLVGVTLQYWCASLGHSLPLLRLVAAGVILKIVGIVPVTINNVGWSEGATLVLLEWAGVPRSAALAVGVLQRVAGIALSLIGAGLQWWLPASPAAEPGAESAGPDE